MHNDILEAKIEAAKRRREKGVDMGRCLSLLAMLDDRKTENLQRVGRHEENELLAQVELIEEIEKFMKGD